MQRFSEAFVNICVETTLEKLTLAIRGTSVYDGRNKGPHYIPPYDSAVIVRAISEEPSIGPHDAEKR